MPPHTDALVIFARAPQLGRVKTRLAAELGDQRALAVYRELAERAVGAVRGAAPVIVVSYAPPDAADEMTCWLGGDLLYDPQAAGDLGARMHAAIAARRAAGARRVVVIGTDCPGVTAPVVRSAFAALDDADLVLGPAADGGYYLIGMREPHAVLFHDVPWSTDRTLAVTLERARAARLRVALLHTLRDVDTADDWRAYAAAGE
jgi:rSAM/selenodomain-associated transferase 1